MSLALVTRMTRLISVFLLTAFLTISARAIDNNCSTYAVGETRSFSLTNEAGLQADYTVTKQSEFRSMVTINLDFGDRPKLRARIHQCFRQYNNYYSSPRGVALHLYEPTDSEPAPRPHKVTIDPSISRAGASSYSGNEDCMTYVHEGLHVAGLVDEYAEALMANRRYETKLFWGLLTDIKYETSPDGTSRGLPNLFDCRSTSDSVMKNEWVYKQPPYSNSIKSVRVCIARVGTSRLEGPQGLGDGESDYFFSHRSCPTNYVSLGVYKLEAIYQTSTQEFIRRAGLSEKSVILSSVIYRNGSTEPLHLDMTPLRRAHIKALLWPTCEGFNQVYRQCISNAYRTSVRHNGEGCNIVPAVCARNNEWLN